MKTRKQQATEATRAALLRVARQRFAEEGFSGAEIGRIAAEARVTTGAIYHHFGSKQGLFQAVAEDLEAELLAEAAQGDDPDPWRRLQRAFERLIDMAGAPAVRRILFVEAPQVFGPEAWREIEMRYAYGAMQGAITALQAGGALKPYPAPLIARTLLALLHETSAELERSNRDPAVRAQIGELVADVFGVFRA